MELKNKITIIIISFFLLCSGCQEKKDASLLTVKSSDSSLLVMPIEKIFPVPYFPEKKDVLLGKAVDTFSKDWVFACVFSEQTMSAQQKEFMKSLPMLQKKGVWGTSFERDFDGDKHLETVYYGVYQKQNGDLGNFLLITRGVEGNIEIVLLREVPDSDLRFSCFYLMEDDNSMFFGSGLIGSELSWKLSWTQEGPVLISLYSD